MFLVKVIMWFCILASTVVCQEFELSSGFYQSSSKEDSLEVIILDENKLDLKLSDGSKARFHLENDLYKMKNLSGDGYTVLRLLNETKFEIF